MAVIVVILILLTLFVPTLAKVRKKARTVICANQVKQLGVLIGTYANDHDGRLPYSNNNFNYLATGKPSYLDDREKGHLYGGWAGHLMPYFDLKIKSWGLGFWNYENSSCSGCCSNYDWTFNAPSDDIDRRTDRWGSKNGLDNWQLMQDMFFEGGHGDLKTVICPEAPNTFTNRYYNDEKRVPRVSGILPYRWGSLKGLPSSYLAHGALFNGKGNVNSVRLEDVFSSNYLLLEGVDHYSQYINGMTAPSYTQFFTYSAGGGNAVNKIVGSKDDMAASFMHDDTEEVWFSNQPGYNGPLKFADGQRYTRLFGPTSIASVRWNQFARHHHKLVSNQYPGEKWENFEIPQSKGKFLIQRHFTADDSSSYIFGNMNILLADFSVKNAHVGWLFENGRTLGQVNE